jgi:hypothetical protein
MRLENQESVIVKFVADFAQEMNDWEARYFVDWEEISEKQQQATSAKKELELDRKEKAMHSSYAKEYKKIFMRYCTEKERKYGGPEGPKSAGIPTKYAGVRMSSFVGHEQKNSSRAEVTFTGEAASLKYFYNFVLLKKKGEWRIDGFKTRLESSEKWSNGIL